MVLGIPVEDFFLNTTGLYALLALIPLILFYLIKPKPKEKTIPSLMFFLKDMGASDKRSFLERFSKDWLFWLQLLVLLLTALAMAKPFTEVPESSLARNTVIVLDASASMQTVTPDGKTRFQKAKEDAISNLGSTNTIILARNVPIVAKEGVDKEEAKRFLEGLDPVDTSTAIYDAARSALDYSGDDTRVVVLSDFLETEVDNDVTTVKSALTAQGASVEFKPYVSEANNIGIVDVVVKEDKTSVQVRNYYPEEKTVQLSVGDITEELTIASGAAEVFTFSTPVGVSTVEIDVDDDLPADNKAFISTPKTTRLKVLFITNDQNVEKSNLWVALKAINEKSNYQLTIEKRVPPKSVAVEHDIVVLDEFGQDKILPGVFKDIQEQVEEKGGSLIITPQRGMFNFGPLKPLLPVTLEGEEKTGSDIEVTEPAIEKLTRDVQFGHVDYYYATEPKQGVREIAHTVKDNSTIIAHQQRGVGDILYYGIFDHDVKVDGETKKSTFKNDLFYPIFWKRALDLVTETPSVRNLNRRTGEVIDFGEDREVETPGGSTVEGMFSMDQQGIYTFRNRAIAANLINSQESDVAGEFTEAEPPQIDTEEVEEKKPKPLTQWFVIGGLIILFLELIYTKFRGDM